MSLELFGLQGIPLVQEGDNIANLILDALKRENQTLEDGDIILIAETLISKAEGNFIKLGDILPSDDAIIFAIWAYGIISPAHPDRQMPITGISGCRIS